MKFVHCADIHLGSWSEQKMREVSSTCFSYVVSFALDQAVDFFLIAGDLFNTAMPSIDSLRFVVKELVRLKKGDIPVYVVPGSHDFSPTGKSMIDVLEEAGLLTNVFRGRVSEGKLQLRFTVDKKTGAKLVGIIGKKGQLDRSYYEHLERDSLESEQGFKIFLFHTAITELKPTFLSEMASHPLSLLPRHFDYYAGGHVHVITDVAGELTRFADQGYPNIVFPGPVFPVSFSEIEKLKQGSFFYYNNGAVEQKTIPFHDSASFVIDCDGISSDEVLPRMLEVLEKEDVAEKIVTVRLFGTISHGRLADIDYSRLFSSLYKRGAYFVMKNTRKLRSPEFVEVHVDEANVEDIEDALIAEHKEQLTLPGIEDIGQVIKDLMHVLGTEKQEDEKVMDYDQQVLVQTNDYFSKRQKKEF
ncbi:MAG: exonuclease SbcCD subunit D [Candidatus Woesearchaeota archaeon]|nr:MAG: exonuclease SbcCD subunit D [Candidatus Woesearchaeota archaeon]